MAELISSSNTKDLHITKNYALEWLAKYLKDSWEIWLNGLPIDNSTMTLAIADFHNMLQKLWKDLVHHLIIANNPVALIAEARKCIYNSQNDSHPKKTHIWHQQASDITMRKTKNLLILCSYLKPQLQLNNTIIATKDAANDALIPQKKFQNNIYNLPEIVQEKMAA